MLINEVIEIFVKADDFVYIIRYLCKYFMF